MQAMIKTSRLETGVISLEQKQQPVYDTLAAALGGILLNAEKKQIDVQVECPEHLDARHDRKWTSEALFNILDNAVKYTRQAAESVCRWKGWENVCEDRHCRHRHWHLRTAPRDDFQAVFTGKMRCMMWTVLGLACIWPARS